MSYAIKLLKWLGHHQFTCYSILKTKVISKRKSIRIKDAKKIVYDIKMKFAKHNFIKKFKRKQIVSKY